MSHKWLKAIFQNGSTTYFYSSLFFPKEALEDVTKLYSFVRVADDFVDQVPQNPEGLQRFIEETQRCLEGGETDDLVIQAFCEVAKKYDFDRKWIKSFLYAMKSDLHKLHYQTMVELERYMYGSAEVIGLMMAKIMGVNEEAYPSARMLGKAMQYINFLRDIEEDVSLGRQYIPQEIINQYDLTSLEKDEAKMMPEAFSALYNNEVTRFLTWDDEARLGFSAIPKRYRIAVKTASDMYRWTALELREDPFLVYEKKLKPHKARILAKGTSNIFFA